MSLQTTQPHVLSPAMAAALKPASQAAPAAVKPPSAAARHAALRDALLATVVLLKSRRASEIDASFIDDYVTLNWLEWHGGGLRLTTTGENICKQLAVRGPESGD